MPVLPAWAAGELSRPERQLLQARCGSRARSRLGARLLPAWPGLVQWDQFALVMDE